MAIIGGASALTWIVTAADALPRWFASPAYEAATWCVPVDIGTNVVEHVAGSLPPIEHEAGVNVPAPVVDHDTVPIGAVAAPAPLSATVAVQFVDRPVTRIDAAHDASVELGRFETPTGDEPLLPTCVVSPPYEAVTVCVPADPADGVNDTEHADVPSAPVGVHIAGENDPLPVADHEMAPPGAPGGHRRTRGRWPSTPTRRRWSPRRTRPTWR
jgi:hypothetical protein